MAPGKIIDGAMSIARDLSRQLFATGVAVPPTPGRTSPSHRYHAEEFEGRNFRLYSKSPLPATTWCRGTFATDEHPGPRRHWCVVCLDHLLDPVGRAEPNLRRVKPA